jgi:hypothetical protein
MSVIAMMLLFVALQPGVLLTLPAVGRSVFMSGKMSVQAVMVHALIFAVVVYVFRRGGYFEGFYDTASFQTTEFVQVNPSGFVQAPSGFVQAPSGFVQAPSGFVQAPSGFVQAPSGPMQPMPGQIITPMQSHVPMERTRPSPKAMDSVLKEVASFKGELESKKTSPARIAKIQDWVKGRIRVNESEINKFNKEQDKQRKVLNDNYNVYKKIVDDNNIRAANINEYSNILSRIDPSRGGMLMGYIMVPERLLL